MTPILPRRIAPLVAILVTVISMALAQSRAVSDADVRRVDSSAILIDTHNDITSRTVDGYDIGKAKNDGHTNVTALKEGGVGAQFFAVYVSGDYVKGNRSAHRTLEMIDTVRHDIIGRYPNDFVLATTADDIERIHKQGKIAALMGIEGGHAIEDSLRLLRDYYDLGIRYMTLTHSNTNDWADSSGDFDKAGIAHHNGLTDFGKQVVREMNRLGMLVDISHVADKTFWDALGVSTAPIIASHSSCRALADVPRNMTDDMLRAVGQYGGVVMVNFYSSFLSNDYRLAVKAQEPAIKQAVAEAKAKLQAEGKPVPNELAEQIEKSYTAKIPRPPLSVLIDHIDHIAKIAGIDHVGLGSDFDGIPSSPEGMDSAADLPKITQALMARGYSAEDMHKILGGNFLRVFAKVQEVSKQLQAESRPRITEKQPFDKK